MIDHLRITPCPAAFATATAAGAGWPANRSPAAASRFPRGQHALAVGVAAPVAIALRRDQHVIAHGVQAQPAERAAIGGRLAASHRPDRPPSRLLELRHSAYDGAFRI